MSHPTITVAAGQTATFASGRDIPVPVTTNTASGSQTGIEYKKAEFSFTVTPTLQVDGSVRLDILQENSDVLETVVVAGSQIPQLSTQKLQTSVTIARNQLLYLGGIEITTRQDADKGTPYLRKVPVINWVFGHQSAREEHSELFVILTAEVWRQGEGPVRIERAIPVCRPSSRSTILAPRAGSRRVQPRRVSKCKRLRAARRYGSGLRVSIGKRNPSKSCGDDKRKYTIIAKYFLTTV